MREEADEEPVEDQPEGEEERRLRRQRGEEPREPDEDQEDAGSVLRRRARATSPLAMKASPVGTASAIVGASPVTWSLVMTAVMAPAAARSASVQTPTMLLTLTPEAPPVSSRQLGLRHEPPGRTSIDQTGELAASRWT